MTWPVIPLPLAGLEASRARLAQRCGSCGHGEAKKGGFVVCPFGKKRDWRNPSAVCSFEPSRWTPVKVGS